MGGIIFKATQFYIGGNIILLLFTVLSLFNNFVIRFFMYNVYVQVKI